MKKRLSNAAIQGFPAFERHETDGWRRSVLFRGSTQNTDWLGIHMSQLEAGNAPEPVVKHQEEELKIVLQGEIVVGLCDKQDSPEITREEVLKPGDFVFHPSVRYHYQENQSQLPATYLTLKWHANIRCEVPDISPGRSCLFSYSKVSTPAAEVIVDTATTWLDRLEVHASGLAPGAGYASHKDAHDVVIVVLEGEVTFDNIIYPAGSCLLHPGGWKHGLRNSGRHPAHYLVVELHGKPVRHQLSEFPELTRDTLARFIGNLTAR